MEFGIHLTLPNYYDPTNTSPNLAANQVSAFDSTRLQTSILEIGSGWIRLADPRVFSNEPNYSGQIVTGTARTKLADGTLPAKSYRAVAGTDTLYMDTTGVVIGLIDRWDSVWQNYNCTPVGPNGQVDVGQNIQLVINNHPGRPTGNWSVSAEGTVTFALILPGNNRKTFAFVNGVCADTTLPVIAASLSSVWLLHIQSNVSGKNIRVLMPGFHSLYKSSPIPGATPGGYVWHPEYVSYYETFSTIRFANSEVNNTNAPPKITTWDSRPLDQEAIGSNSQIGIPLEQKVALCNAAQSNMWTNLPWTVTDEYIQRSAEYIRDNLHPSLKVFVAAVLEAWNWQYAGKQVVIALYARSLAKFISTVKGCVKANHGFKAGDKVWVSGAQSGNTTYTVASAPDANTFLLNTTPLVPLIDHDLMVYPADTKVIKAPDLTFTLSQSGFSGRFTFAGPKGTELKAGDYITIGDVADGNCGGIYRIGTVTGTEVTFGIYAGHDRPLPTKMRDGTLSMPGTWRKIISNSGEDPSVPQADAAAGRGSAQLHYRIHAIYQAVLGDRCYPVGEMWSIDNAYNENFVAEYLKNPKLKNVGLAGAPYMNSDNGGKDSVSEASLTGAYRIIVAPTLSGKTATVKLTAHGFVTGDKVQMGGFSLQEYNGVYQIKVVDADNFTYELKTAPTDSPTAVNFGMFACKNFVGREIMGNAPWNTYGTAFTSVGHGFATGDMVRVLGSEYLGARKITKISDDVFGIDNCPSPAVNSYRETGTRLWCVFDSASQLIFTALKSQTDILAATAKAINNRHCVPNGFKYHCYESGQHIVAISSHCLISQLYSDVQQDPRMADTYIYYYNSLAAAGIEMCNHFQGPGTMGGKYMFGTIPYMNAPKSMKQVALETLIRKYPKPPPKTSVSVTVNGTTTQVN